MKLLLLLLLLLVSCGVLLRCMNYIIYRSNSWTKVENEHFDHGCSEVWPKLFFFRFFLFTYFFFFWLSSCIWAMVEIDSPSSLLSNPFLLRSLIYIIFDCYIPSSLKVKKKHQKKKFHFTAINIEIGISKMNSQSPLPLWDFASCRAMSWPNYNKSIRKIILFVLKLISIR